MGEPTVNAAALEFTLEELEAIYSWHGIADQEYGPLSKVAGATADMIKDAIEELKPKVSWLVSYDVINREQHDTVATGETEYQARDRALSQAVDKHPMADEITVKGIKRVK